ncbi:MAG: hypothetical protein HND57_05025 [Planctomycetes bacterium]|nr:hypothetical protein [Planctomycetota bacterium]
MTLSPARLLMTEADNLFRSRSYADAQKLYEKAASAAQAAPTDTATLIEALSQVARSHLIQDRPDEGAVWLERAAELASSEEPAGWSRYIGVKGRFEWKRGDNETATATFKDMYAYCLEYELHDRAVDAAHMVAITAGPEQQIEWGKKGIAAAEEGGIESWLGPLWNNLGWTYSDMGEHDQALAALQKAREYHWQTATNEQAKLVADWSIAHAWFKVGDIKNALIWLRPTLAWAERRYAEKANADTAEWVGHSHKLLADIAEAQEKPGEALTELKLALQYLKKAKMPKWDADGYKELEVRAQNLQSQ